MPRSIPNTFSTNLEDDVRNIECKASYLSVSSSLDRPIDSKKYFKKAVQQAGRNPSEKLTDELWEAHSSTINYEDYCAILKKLRTPARDELLKVFKTFDLNGDGYISHSELKTVLMSQGEKMSEREVEKIFSDADTNNDGKLDYSEFCTVILSTTQKCQQNNIKRLAATNSKKPARPSSSKFTRPSSSKSSRPSSSKSASVRPLPRYISQTSSTTKFTEPTESNGNSVTFKCEPVSEKTSAPKSLKSWKMSSSKGCFYLDNENGSILTHQYTLWIPTTSEVWISVKAYHLSHMGDVPKTPVDASVLIFRKASRLEFVGLANLRENFQYCWKSDMRAGSYLLVPFTTQCRLSRRKTEPKDSVELIRKDQTGRAQLSKAFTETLHDMFEMCDLDSNGLLSRDEFNWFQLLTSEEEVDDEAWQIVESNFQMKNGELTRSGFEQLHLMQAREENADPVEEFLDTLMCMGYNKALDLDQAAPFEITVHASSCAPELSASFDLKPEFQYAETEKKIMSSVMQLGEKRDVPGLPGLDWYVYRDDGRISSVLYNSTDATTDISVKYSDLINCVSANGKENYQCTLVPNSSKLIDHFMAVDETDRWSVTCEVSRAADRGIRRLSSSRPRSANKKRSSLSDLF